MKTLLVVRTPFQAWLAQKVLEKEEVKSFDIVYFTQHDSEEDRYYYSQLSHKSNQSDYIFVRPQRFDILSHLIFRLKAHKWYQQENYDLVIYASIDALVPNSLISKHKHAKLITFDDGAANVFINGIFNNEAGAFRNKFYRMMIRSKSLKAIKNRISRHYTTYSNKDNIVESKRLFYLDGWGCSSQSTLDDVKTYFIGAPFEEIMNTEQIIRLENYVRQLQIDCYVTHPRERKTLNISAKFLKKNGRIAEDAIISDAKGRKIRLVGWLSTVMLNLESICEDSVVLLPKESIQTPELTKLSMDFGCRVILI